MKLDDAMLAKNSYMGSCLTLIIAMTTRMVVDSKTITIIEKNDVDIFGVLVENAIDMTEKFTA